LRWGNSAEDFRADHASLNLPARRSFARSSSFHAAGGKFTDSSAADFRKMRARAGLFAHFLRE